MSHHKTTQMLIDAIHQAATVPGAHICFISQNKEEIRRYIWRQLLGMLADEYIEVDPARYVVHFANASCIRLMRQDEDRQAIGLRFDKITGDGWGPFWKTRLKHSAPGEQGGEPCINSP